MASTRYFSEVRMLELQGLGEAPAGRPSPRGADLVSAKRTIEASLELADKVEDRQDGGLDSSRRDSGRDGHRFGAYINFPDIISARASPPRTR